MVNLEYMIIYFEDGTPIYSRCFGAMCKRSMSDDALFSAFLSSINTFAKHGDQQLPEEMELEGETIKIHYSEENKINTIMLQDLELIFYYTQLEGITIAAGINAKEAEEWRAQMMFQELLKEVEKFLKDYLDINWKDVETQTILEMESALLSKVILPFFEKYDMKNRCQLGDNCPYRLALYEGRGISIFDKLKHKVREIGNSSIFTKMKLMITGKIFNRSKYKTDT